jgi:hypothetical protein
VWKQREMEWRREEKRREEDDGGRYAIPGLPSTCLRTVDKNERRRCGEGTRTIKIKKLKN